jgi:hypothetical protein
MSKSDSKMNSFDWLCRTLSGVDGICCVTEGSAFVLKPAFIGGMMRIEVCDAIDL